VKGASLRDVAVVLAAIPARVYAAAALLAATLAVAVWLYTYRVSELYEYIDRAGTHYHPAERMSVQPWWSTPATIVVLVLGVAATISLLPKRRRIVARTFGYLAKPGYWGRARQSR
jgi:hypothetical protein